MRHAHHVSIGTLLALAAMAAMGCRDTTAPSLGDLNVAVSTQGATADLDPDGYVLNIDGVPGQTVGNNATITLAGVPAGRHVVLLDGLSSNCSVVGSNPKSVDVVASSPISISFFVACAQRKGALQLSTTTSGVDIDMDGFYLSLLHESSNFSSGAEVPATGSVTIPALQPGSYLLSFHSVAANCDVVPPSPRTIVVAPEGTTVASLSFTCEKAGELAFVTGTGSSTNIYVVKSNGTGTAPLTVNPTADIDPAWSPDGSKLAFASDRDGNLDIHVMNADKTNAVRITTAPGSDVRPAWSPDGARIVFVSNRDGPQDIYVMNADGTNTVRITNDAFSDTDPAWSPDGRRIAFQSERAGTTTIWMVNVDGSGLTRVTTGERGDRHPAWSPDGTRIAFSRGAPLTVQDIYFVNADGSGLTQVTRGQSAAADPAWSPNGRRIAFTSSSYYYGSEIAIVTIDSQQYSSVTSLTPSTNPAWRP